MTFLLQWRRAKDEFFIEKNKRSSSVCLCWLTKDCSVIVDTQQCSFISRLIFFDSRENEREKIFLSLFRTIQSRSRSITARIFLLFSTGGTIVQSVDCFQFNERCLNVHPSIAPNGSDRSRLVSSRLDSSHRIVRGSLQVPSMTGDRSKIAQWTSANTQKEDENWSIPSLSLAQMSIPMDPKHAENFMYMMNLGILIENTSCIRLIFPTQRNPMHFVAITSFAWNETDFSREQRSFNVFHVEHIIFIQWNRCFEELEIIQCISWPSHRLHAMNPMFVETRES